MGYKLVCLHNQSFVVLRETSCATSTGLWLNGGLSGYIKFWGKSPALRVAAKRWWSL
jgi:hypothetical protein